MCGVKERVAFWGMEVGNMREMRGIFYLIKEFSIVVVNNFVGCLIFISCITWICGTMLYSIDNLSNNLKSSIARRSLNT
jgi:hypothetical protein